MNRFSADEKVEDSSKDIQQSSRYDDKELMLLKGEEALLALDLKLDAEIDQCLYRLDKLERLATRYHEDGIAAKNDREMGYYQRYAKAYERVQMAINAHYAQLPSVV